MTAADDGSGVASWAEVDADLAERWRLDESLFQPSAVEARRLHLHRCMRVLPHLNDTGGFFVALIRKSATAPTAPVAAAAAVTAATPATAPQVAAAAAAHPTRRSDSHPALRPQTAEYLSGVGPALEAAVSHVLLERPADPLAVIARHLTAAAAAGVGTVAGAGAAAGVATGAESAAAPHLADEIELRKHVDLLDAGDDDDDGGGSGAVTEDALSTTASEGSAAASAAANRPARLQNLERLCFTPITTPLDEACTLRAQLGAFYGLSADFPWDCLLSTYAPPMSRPRVSSIATECHRSPHR